MWNYMIVNGELYHADELMHYGVKGMKWGVRKVRPRYNSDGTLTPYGKKYKARLEKSIEKRKKRDEKEYRRTHNEDGSYNETAQREHFKALKKGKKPTELYEGYDDDNYREAINRRRAASDLGEALNGGMVPKKLRSDDLWDRSDEDWSKAHEIIEKKNREVVDNFLGKYKDQYLSSYDKKWNMNAGKRFANEYERIASNMVFDDRTYNKYFLDYFDHSDHMSDELYHHGIKGQKHGVRQWQNKDGSLTPAGRIRYGASKVGEKVSGAIKKKREERRIEKLRKKPLSKLTDEELKERIARLTEEKKASDLQKQISDVDENRLSMGKKFTQAALTKVVAPAAIDAGRQVLTSWFKKQGMDIAGLGEVKDAYSMIKKEADLINAQRKMSDDKVQIRKNDDWLENRDKDLKEREAKRKKEAAEKKVNDEIEKTIKNAEEVAKKAERERKEAEEREANKVYTGKVSGKGTNASKKEKAKKEQKPSDYYDPIETDFINRDATVSNTRNTSIYRTGMTGVKRLLLTGSVSNDTTVSNVRRSSSYQNALPYVERLLLPEPK